MQRDERPVKILERHISGALGLKEIQKENVKKKNQLEPRGDSFH